MALTEAGRCMNCKDPKCVAGCPVSVPIPRFIQAIKAGEFDQALEIIRSANLLPAVCGRVCPQESQCEQRCTLGKEIRTRGHRPPGAVCRGPGGGAGTG